MTDNEWIRLDQQHQREMAEIKSREAWREREALTARIGYFAWAFGIVGVVAILAWMIVSYSEGNAERGQQLEQACIAAGGTWTQFGGSAGKMCVHLEKVEQ